MTDTPVSLLERIRIPGDDLAWARLVDVYQPMIRSWLAAHGLGASELDDVAQEVLTVVVKKAPQFERQRTGSFRNWLRKVTVNCLRDYRKSAKRKPLPTGDSDFQEMLAQLQDADSGLTRRWNEQHDRYVVQYLFSQLQSSFEPTTLQAFSLLMFEEKSPDEVAQTLGISVNAVFIAKSRVLARLREEGKGLID